MLNGVLDHIRMGVRGAMRLIAIQLNWLSRGKITPNMVTIVGLLAHIPIAWLIATEQFYWAAGLLVVFGLFDTLDGELARLQKRASNAGMLLDATTDRMKEILLYTGAAYALVDSEHPYYVVWAVAACGSALLVSYVKAKGETAVKDTKLSPGEINRLFQDGIMRFEVRMAVLVIGLLFDALAPAIVLIAVLSVFTALSRLTRISRKLQ